ncbi:MAG: 2OG-Fe(II) oxygenase [Casimicrobium sp.]|jgi:PKHD-type hydroxylase
MKRASITSIEQNDYLTRPYVMPRLFEQSECVAIRALAEKQMFTPGGLIDLVPDYRICDVATLARTEDTDWIYRRICDLVATTNRIWYQFELNGRDEGLQFIRYRTNGKIDWHADLGPRAVSTRKLSITVQLSEAGGYEGGMLEFAGDKFPEISNTQGDAIIFPSYLVHRITSVLTGSRYSLVSWFHGSSFK